LPARAGPQGRVAAAEIVDNNADRHSEDNWVLMDKALKAIGEMHRADDQIESLLLKIFERAYRASQAEPDGPFWRAAFPSDVAKTLHKLFPRYPEPESAFDLKPEPYLRKPPRSCPKR
jgi:hypothetical protein